jgi:hypothetical protein
MFFKHAVLLLYQIFKRRIIAIPFPARVRGKFKPAFVMSINIVPE